jgi:zinc protease
MRKSPLARAALGLAAILGLSVAARAAEPDAPFRFPVHEKTLANGLRVVVAPMPGSGLAAVRTLVRTGSRDEVERGKTGFAHFFEHMMFRGTKTMTADDRERAVLEMGASSSGYTDADITNYTFEIAAEDLPRVIELEADRFMNLHYTDQQFQTEAGAVYGEYRKNRATPFFQLEEALSKTAFKRHTYGHTTMGYEKDIAAMPKAFAYSRRFFERFYRPENTFLIVAGDVSPDGVFALAEKHFGPWKRGYVPPRVPREPEQTAERRVEVTYDGKTLPIVMFAYKSPAYDPDSVEWVSTQVLAELAFGETSAVYRQLVLDERSVQQLSASPAMSRDPGLFLVAAVVSDPAKLDGVIGALEKAIADAQKRAVDPKRVAATASNLRYGLILRLDEPADVADHLSYAAALTGDARALERHAATLAKVTPETVAAAAKRLLDPRRRTVAMLKEKAQ